MAGRTTAALFETNLRDDRYLPFEGRGVISDWRLQLADHFRQFDYDTISDVVLHLRYTARDGGEPLPAARRITALDQMTDGAGTGWSGCSVDHRVPDEWSRFLIPSDANGDQSVTIELNRDRLPFVSPPNQRDRFGKLFVKATGRLRGHNESTLKLALEPEPMSATGSAVAPWTGCCTLSGRGGRLASGR